MIKDTPDLVAIIYSFERAGSERLGATVAEVIAARGWNVRVCATHAGDGPLRAELEARGIACTGFDVERYNRLDRRCRIYRELAAMRPQVLHVQHFSMLALCYLPARLARVPRVVVTEHSDAKLRASPGLRRRAMRLARSIDAVTVIHPRLRDYVVQELCMPADHVHTIANGVDTGKYRPLDLDQARSTQIGPEEMVIGCVARLHPDKDHMNLLEAFSLLPAGTARLLLVGEGLERSRLEARVHALGLSHRVEFLGERADIASLMPQFDCLVLASRTEGLPLVLIEAMACGVPCVATAVGGVPDLLSPDAGIVVPPGNPGALAEALDGLRLDPQRRAHLASRSRSLAVSRYDMEKMVDAYSTVLQLPSRDQPATRQVAM